MSPKTIRLILRGLALLLAVSGPSLAAPAATRTFTVTDTPASASRSTTVTVSPTLTALGQARVWMGLANSDAVGFRLDLLAEVFVNDAKVGQGQANNISAGSSGFNNALLDSIDLGLTGGPVTVGAERRNQAENFGAADLLRREPRLRSRPALVRRPADRQRSGAGRGNPLRRDDRRRNERLFRAQ